MYKVLSVLVAITVNAAVHMVNVAENGATRFSPDTITAIDGDLVIFKFFKGSGAHSVVASTFERPCSPSDNYFYSGPQYGDAYGETTFTIKINESDPIWYYSSLNSDCSNGMVGVINPPKDKNIRDYAIQASDAIIVAPSNLGGGDLEGGAVTIQELSTSTSSEPGFSAETTMPTTILSATTSGLSSVITSSAAATATAKNFGNKKSSRGVRYSGVIVGGLIALL